MLCSLVAGLHSTHSDRPTRETTIDRMTQTLIICCDTSAVIVCWLSPSASPSLSLHRSVTPSLAGNDSPVPLMATPQLGVMNY